jgi:hypothetical protein
MPLFAGLIGLGRPRAREDGTSMTTAIQARRCSAGGGIGRPGSARSWINKGCMPHDYLGGCPETHLEILLPIRFAPP